MNEIRDFLKYYGSTYFISGHEYMDNNIIYDYFKPYVDTCDKDGLGSLNMWKKGKSGKTIMLVAHMDEIGLMVKSIDEDGLVSLALLGGFNPLSLIGQEVDILGKEKVYGVIGSKVPAEENEDGEKPVEIDDLFVDTGFSREELLEKISIGSPAGVRREPFEAGSDCFVSRGLDDKAGVATMLETAKELAESNLDADICFTASAQEEVGIRGAFTSGSKIRPDMVIAIDVGFGSTPDCDENDTLDMGKGPGIALGAAVNNKLNKKLFDVARKEGYGYQYDVFPELTGCDGDAIFITGTGIPCIVISVPIRYMHSPVEIVNCNDIKNTGKLLARFIEEIDGEELEELLCF